MKELQWYVYTENINKREIEIYNIFDHSSFKKDIINSFNENWNESDIIESAIAFREKVKNIVSYYFSGKCEWEIILSDWPPAPEGKFNKKKISVYDQLMLNWNPFTNYIIECMICY